jgi:hypothetical protein
MFSFMVHLTTLSVAYIYAQYDNAALEMKGVCFCETLATTYASRGVTMHKTTADVFTAVRTSWLQLVKEIICICNGEKYSNAFCECDL